MFAAPPVPTPSPAALHPSRTNLALRQTKRAGAGVVLVLLSATWAWAATPVPRCVAIMGTNDVHGALEPYTVADAASGLTVKTGGVMAASAYIDNLRRVFGPRALVLDAGDIFQGTLPSNMSLGKAMIDAYNAAGYDAAAIGNHEFDFGALPGQDPCIPARRLGVLQQRIREAKFPFLAANIFDRATKAPIEWDNVQPSILRDLDGIKVGIIGASTPTTPSVTKAQNVETLEFRAPAPYVLQEARALRAQGADFIVLVAHMGGRCGAPESMQKLTCPADIASCDASPEEAELLALLAALPPGTLDVAIGGHTHQFVAHWVHGVATLESGAQGRYIGWVEACLTPTAAGKAERKHIDMHTSQIHGAIPLCLQTWDDGTCSPHTGASAVHPATFLARPLVPNPAVQEAVAPYLQAVAALGQKPMGVAMLQQTPPSVLCQWVAEAMRRATHSDFGLQTPGGVRTALPAGPITFSDVYQVLPFDNFVCQIKLTGSQLTQLALHLGRQSLGAQGAVFVGLKTQSTPSGATVVTDKGKPLEPERLYTLATSDFMLHGGDDADGMLNKVPQSRAQISDIGMRDAFADFLVSALRTQSQTGRK